MQKEICPGDVIVVKRPHVISPFYAHIDVGNTSLSCPLTFDENAMFFVISITKARVSERIIPDGIIDQWSCIITCIASKTGQIAHSFIGFIKKVF